MGLYRRPDSSIWWMSYTKGAKQVRESTLTSDKEEAKLRLAERMAGLRRPGKATIGNILDGVLADYRLNGFNLKFAEDKIEGHLRPWFGDRLAESLTKQDIQEFVNTKSQGKKHLSNASINRCLALLKQSFNLAELPHPTITMLKEAAPRSGFVEKEKFWEIFNRLPEHQRAPVLFAYESGARIQEVLNLRWKQLDWVNGVVRLDPGTTKNDDARIIPCSKMMMFYFDRLNKQRVCEFCFTFQGKHLRSIRTGWLKAVGKSKLLVHDLRRSGVRNLIRAGVPERVAMQISGHKTRSVFDRYNIVSENDLTNAMLTLEKYHFDTIEYNPKTVPELASFSATTSSVINFASMLLQGASHQRAPWPVDKVRRRSTCRLRGVYARYLHQAHYKFVETSDLSCRFLSVSFFSLFPPMASMQPEFPRQPRLEVRG